MGYLSLMMIQNLKSNKEKHIIINIAKDFENICNLVVYGGTKGMMTRRCGFQLIKKIKTVKKTA